MSYRYERTHYRVVYPLAARPKFRMGTLIVPVADLSELGMRLVLPSDWKPAVGDIIEGEVRLVSGGVVDVEGEILRLTPPFAAGRLSRGVPFVRIMEEQRWLQQRFLNWL